ADGTSGIRPMRLELRGHHVDITPALRRLVSTKVGKIEHLLNHGAVSVKAIAQQAKKVKNKRQDRTRHRAKTGVAAAAALTTGGLPRAAAAARAPRTPLAARERVRMPPILRASRQAVQPMSAADAARPLDAGGDGVVVFRDLETRSISVLYRRPDGELALVETKA